MNLFGSVFFSLWILQHLTASQGEPCPPIYVRWSRVRLQLTAKVSGPYTREQCETACTKNEHPARAGYFLECAGFNHKEGANSFSHDCQIFQKYQLGNLDGLAEADDRFSFYWKYCGRKKLTCNSHYHFSFHADRYMDKTEVMKAFSAESLEECLGKCLVESSFTCRSVSFNRTDNGCFLSAQNQLSKPRYIRVNNNPNFRIDYYESNCFNNSFDFKHDCFNEGLMVTVDSKYPYTGVLYGLYDYFTCRFMPRGLRSFSHFFPYPEFSKNCTDSYLRKGSDYLLEVVLSTDGVEPLYFITPEDLTYQARCPGPKKIPGQGKLRASVEFYPKTIAKTSVESTSHSTASETSATTSVIETKSTTTLASPVPEVTGFPVKLEKVVEILPHIDPDPNNNAKPEIPLLGSKIRVKLNWGESSTTVEPESTRTFKPSHDTSEATTSISPEKNVVKSTLEELTESPYGSSLKSSFTETDAFTTESTTAFTSIPSALLNTTSAPTLSSTALFYSSTVSNETALLSASVTLEPSGMSSVSQHTMTAPETVERVTEAVKNIDTKPPTVVTSVTPSIYNTTTLPIKQSTIPVSTSSDSAASKTDILTSEPQTTSPYYTTSEGLVSEYVTDSEIPTVIVRLDKNQSNLPTKIVKTSIDTNPVILKGVIDQSSGKSKSASETLVTDRISSPGLADSRSTVYASIRMRSTAGSFVTLSTTTTSPATSTTTTTPTELTPATITTTKSTKPLSVTVTTAYTTRHATTSTSTTTTTASTTTTTTSTTTTTTTSTTKKTTTLTTVATTTTAASAAAVAPLPSNTQQPILFDVFHRGQPIEAVVVGSNIALTLTPYYAIPPSYMTVAGCQVEPVGSIYEWEREPLAIVRDGCQADNVGLVCPPERTDFGIRVMVEAFRYQSTAQVQYTCLVRICPYAPCPQKTCPPVEGCTGTSPVVNPTNSGIFSRLGGGRSKRQTFYGMQNQFLPGLRVPGPQPSSELLQYLTLLAGDHVVSKRLIIVNSENELQFYIRTGSLPTRGGFGFFHTA